MPNEPNKKDTKGKRGGSNCLQQQLSPRQLQQQQQQQQLSTQPHFKHRLSRQQHYVPTKYTQTHKHTHCINTSFYALSHFILFLF